MPLISRISSRRAPLSALAMTLLLAACAQSPLNDPHAGRASTQSDAMKTAQGRDVHRASSQLQIDLNNKEVSTKRESEAAASPSARHELAELQEAKTFLGTIPCPAGSTNCVPQKLTVTLAPAGQWRLRSQALDKPGSGQVSSGCWVSTGASPSRIILLNQQEVVMADLSFSSGQVMQVHAFNQQRPTLSTSLTQQADIDPIDEVQGARACP